MPIPCVAVGCSNNQFRNPNLSFYRFPVDIERRNKWISAVKRKDWTPTHYSRLCNEHFISGNISLQIEFIV